MSDIAKGRMATQDLAGRQTPGSVLVHPEFSNTLIRNVEEHGVFRQNALIWPMGSDTVHIPRRIGGLTVFWEGEAEAGTLARRRCPKLEDRPRAPNFSNPIKGMARQMLHSITLDVTNNSTGYADIHRVTLRVVIKTILF